MVEPPPQAAQRDLWQVTPSFHCALHGTVSECPFRFMSCQDDGGADAPSIPGWLKVRVTEQDAGKESE